MRKITFLFLLSNFITYAQEFNDITGNLPQLIDGFCAWGDFDEDGDGDLYYTGLLNSTNPGGGGLYKNDNGEFVLIENSGLPQLKQGEADWADFDGDGDLDIIIMGYSDDAYDAITDIYINNGNGTFSAADSGIMSMYFGDVHFIDINNDNKPDVAITGTETEEYTYITKIYKNNGDGTLTALPAEALPDFPSIYLGIIKFADYDNDGYQDFIISGLDAESNIPYSAIWKNNGDETFTLTNIPVAQLWMSDAEWFDANNDTYVDLVISGSNGSSDSEIHLYLNNGDGSFNEISFLGESILEGDLVTADFDGDGSIDIFETGRHVVSGTSNYVAHLYLNNGSASFSEYTEFDFLAVSKGDADAYDFDNNDLPDLFVTGDHESGSDVTGYAALYKNGETPTEIERNYLPEDFKIYPNPATDSLYIENFNNDAYQIKILDITGKIVYQNNNNQQLKIKVSDYPKGVYFVKIKQEEKTIVHKILIK